MRVVILISGRGSNMAAIIRRSLEEDCHADVVRVISNRPKAAGLETARALGIDAVAIDHKAFPDRDAFEARLDAELHGSHPDLIVCAGFMRILGPSFVAKWTGRLINIHPSLLPKYKGLDTHHRVLNAGDREHGCSVHWVSAELDAGRVIARSRLDIRPTDTPESLARRVNALERDLYPRIICDMARKAERGAAGAI